MKMYAEHPQELIDFRAGLTEEDVESPRKYRKMVSSSRFRTFMK
jgi:hypothetical protein